ncbi:MAG: DUF1446 domain-containing protein [Ignavibacteriales bacterium]|nr:DUF1446 domain-containing protein [Ignavibacteriales bacterium]
MKPSIRIASGQGFWGDLIDAPFYQVTEGQIDYLVMDYLAEVTMSILRKQQKKRPEMGYASDIPSLMERILPVCIEKKIKIITNGGGVNPIACAEAVKKVALKLGIKNLKIGVVSGDDILEEIDALKAKGEALKNMETGESIETVQLKLESANVYFGAQPIVEALRGGADIVITGRTTDTGLTLAPMVYEFDWSFEDYNKMAIGTIAGHILECGAQATGGNFLGNWQDVPNFERIGFPIAEAHPDGKVYITKHESLGGMVTFDTVAEQLVYEIGNPVEYITPDCVADFSSIHLQDEGNNRVLLYGVEGKEATEFYKVSCAYSDGYVSSGTLTYSWPQAATKAKKAAEILKNRLQLLNLSFDEMNAEFIGLNACHGPLAPRLDEDQINEVMLRFSVRSKDFAPVERFGREIAPLVLTGPPAVTGFAGGRPKPSEVVAYWPALLRKSMVTPIVSFVTLGEE